VGIFAEYEKVKNAAKPLPVPLTDKVTVEFPSSPSTEWALDYIQLRAKNGNEAQVDIALAKLPALVGKKTLEKLATHTTFPELRALMRDVLRHYELYKDVEPPNRRKAPKKKTSGRRSSRTSGPSKRTSPATSEAST
jgi:hypothetical protein